MRLTIADKTPVRNCNGEIVGNPGGIEEWELKITILAVRNRWWRFGSDGVSGGEGGCRAAKRDGAKRVKDVECGVRDFALFRLFFCPGHKGRGII